MNADVDRPARDVIVAWLNDPPWPKGEGSTVIRLFGAADQPGLAARLSANGQTELAGHIRTVLASDGDGLQHDDRLRGLLGQAALELAVVAQHPSLFDLIDHVIIVADKDGALFADDLVARLSGASEDHPLMMALTARCAAIYACRYFDQARRYHDANPDVPIQTRDLWMGPSHFPMADGWAHKVAATLWPARYLDMLQAYPPVFQQAAMGSLHGLEIAPACSLICACGPVFSAEGRYGGPVAIFMLLEELETHLIAQAIKSPVAAAASRDQILDAIFARSDGAWMGRAWLQQLIWRGQPRRAGRSDAEMKSQQAFGDELRGALSSRVAPLDEGLFDWIRSEEPLWQVHRLLAEASILEKHGLAAEAAIMFSRAVREGLVTATGRAEGLMSASPEARIVGRVLSSIPKPISWFETLWEETYEVREHLSFHAHRDLDNPAYPALAWGFQALNMHSDPTLDVAAFWRALAAALFETELIDPNSVILDGTLTAIRAGLVQLGAAVRRQRQWHRFEVVM